MNHSLRTRPLSLPAGSTRLPRRSLLWHLVLWCGGLLAVCAAAGIALGAWAGGLLGAALGALLGPTAGAVAGCAWLTVGLGVRLILPPRAGVGGGATLLIALVCGFTAAALGLGVVALTGLAAQAGLVGGAVIGLLAGLALDVVLYD